MSKEIYQNVRKNRFTQVGNGVLWDDTLTLQAKGLLSIFLSNSDDWDLNMKEIITRSKNGRDAHYKIVDELIEHGYFARVEIRKDTKFEGMIYLFSDYKEDVIEVLKQYQNNSTYIINPDKKKKKPITESQDTGKKEEKNPVPENQDTENAGTESQDINNTKGNNTNLNNTNINDKEIDDKENPMTEDKIKVEVNHFEDDFQEVVDSIFQNQNIKLNKSTVTSVRKRVEHAYITEQIHSDFFGYVETSLLNAHDNYLKGSKKRADKRKMQKFVEEDKKRQQQEAKKEPVPFYNWVD